VLEVIGLAKSFGKQVAVGGLSFQVAAGEVVGLVGANGAGKTTTLLSVAGILRPDAGHIRIAGHDLATAPVEAKRRLGFVPDEPALFEYLTVEEHLRFIARLYGVADIDRRLPALLADLDLHDRRRAFPDELSRGMRQKLALGCAFVHDPQVLLLDEPLTGLDPIGIRRMKDAIKHRASGGAAVLLSSHLLDVVSELCARVIVLAHGKALAEGTPRELAARGSEQGTGTLEDAVLDLLTE
jgi:ABC-2 type transport system ATP-binding protein